MNRYSIIETKIKREIVLLKGHPCLWGKCTFCDYIEDNSSNDSLIISLNKNVLRNISGRYGVLEVLNSGNIFELPEQTLKQIRQVIIKNNIHTLFFESHWIYKTRIGEMRDFFGIKTIVKTGLETFDTDFREKVLNKGIKYKNIEEIKKYFDSICILVGIKGQTKEMIRKDIQLATENFDHFTVNVYVKNTTSIEPDHQLIKWFQKEYSYLNELAKCDVLWANTDFGVGI